jgi:hypothetical protein
VTRLAWNTTFARAAELSHHPADAIPVGDIAAVRHSDSARRVDRLADLVGGVVHLVDDD